MQLQASLDVRAVRSPSGQEFFRQSTYLAYLLSHLILRRSVFESCIITYASYCLMQYRRSFEPHYIFPNQLKCTPNKRYSVFPAERSFFSISDLTIICMINVEMQCHESSLVLTGTSRQDDLQIPFSRLHKFHLGRALLLQPGLPTTSNTSPRAQAGR